MILTNFNQMANQEYPGLYQRVVAIFIDSIIMIILMIITVDIFSNFEEVSIIPKIIAFLAIFCLYDPVLTSAFGGTIGHKTNGLRVKRVNNQNKNVLFHLALLRYLVKVLLGWISLLTISGNEKRQAMHDLIAGSVVVFQK